MEMMTKIKIDFNRYSDPFKAVNIHIAMICDFEIGGKITEEEAFEQIKSIYKQFKFFYKNNKNKGDNKNK